MLAERFRCTRAVGKLKAQHGLPARDPGREAEQASRLRHLAAVSGLDPAFAEKFLAVVIREVVRQHETVPRVTAENLAIAIHGLEQIGATDRGVMMFRNQTRRGIRAVQAGRDPAGLCRDPDVVIPTYCNDTVMRIPPDVDAAMDRQRMRETGRRLADGYLEDPPPSAQRATSNRTSGNGLAAEKALEMSGNLATNFPGAH